MNLLTFTAQANSDGIYFVNDNLAGGRRIGRVARVGKLWIATPEGTEFGGPRKAFATRRDAAYALSRYMDTVRDGNEDRNWIYA